MSQPIRRLSEKHQKPIHDLKAEYSTQDKRPSENDNEGQPPEQHIEAEQRINTT